MEKIKWPVVSCGKIGDRLSWGKEKWDEVYSENLGENIFSVVKVV